MKSTAKIIIAGAGGIGCAVGLILREIGEMPFDMYLGDINPNAANHAASYISDGSAKTGLVEAFTMPADGANAAFTAILAQGDILLDCLPGSHAPRMARLAREYDLHYVNLTEYVHETNEIVKIAHGAEKGFVLQTGLAPGFVDVLAHGLFQEFCRQYQVTQVESVAMRVGALTNHAVSPNFYGFTWSPVGVATEYVKPAVVICDFQKTIRPSLADRETMIIRGVTYEAALTSGGAADLPDALSGKTRTLDYKTLRYPGHYAWVESLLAAIPDDDHRIQRLQLKIEEITPMVEDDIVVIYAAVSGRDRHGTLRVKEQSYLIEPVRIGSRTLRAIQATTAAPMAEVAQMLLLNRFSGVVLQSQIAPTEFLHGRFVSAVYHR